MADPDLARADWAACRAQLRSGSRSFFAASLLLPRRVRAPAIALYAFCRLADDAVDLPADGADLPTALARLHARLDRICRGDPAPIPADRALAAVVARHAIPRVLLDALLEGFAWDAGGRRCEDFPALLAYAARVAGAVGAMMALLMGVRDPATLARATDLGVAMQLTNIARDIGEDARAGRLYLPLAWLGEAGIDPDAFLARPAFTPALGGVIRRLLGEADALYARADAGIAVLPADCRPGIAAARRLYAAIGREILRAGGDAVSRRAVVPRARMLALLAAPSSRAPSTRIPAATAPPLAACRFLVEAAARSRPPRLAEPQGAIAARVIWLLDLFARLDQRDAIGRSAS